MKTENKHTPTPWKTIKSEVSGHWIIDNEYADVVAEYLREDDAAHIVEVVNSHESLKAELSSKEALIGELKEALHKANLIIDETEFKDGNTHKMVREALNKLK